MCALVRKLNNYYEDDRNLQISDIKAETFLWISLRSTDSAPRPDGVNQYSDIDTFDQKALQSLTEPK